jgi:PPE family protein
VNFWNDWHDKATGQKTSSERKAETHDRNQRTEQTHEQQEHYHSRGDRQSQAAGHGYDPATITQHDSWPSWDHKQMKTMVDDVDVTGINDAGLAWQKVGGRLANDFAQFHSEVTTAVKGGWTGDAATAAATAPDGMAKWGKAMGAASQGTGSRLQQASTAAKQAQINMPDPVEFSWRRSVVNTLGGGFLGGPGGGAIAGGTDAYAQHKEAQQAKQQAVNVMNRMYTQGYVDVDQTTPAFVAPDDGSTVEPREHKPIEPIIEPPGRRPPLPPGRHDHDGTDGTGSDDGRNGQINQPTDPSRTDPSQFDDNTDDSSTTIPTDPGRTDPSQLDPNGGHTGGGQGGVDPRNAHAAANAGGGMGGGMPMMGGAGGMGGGGDNEYGGRGYGRGGGVGSGAGSGASESGSGGRSGIGGSAAQEAMGGRGGAGRGGPGGMGGGRGGRKEEDAEHETPDYLVETDDVFGSGEMVAPPVIGGE